MEGCWAFDIDGHLLAPDGEIVGQRKGDYRLEVGKAHEKRSRHVNDFLRILNAHDKLVEACQAVLLFHRGAAWDYKAKVKWSKLVGPDNEATTKGMCDNIHAALAEAEKTT